MYDIMKNKFKALLVLSLLFTGFISNAQIQVLTGIEHGTYYKLAGEMNKYLPEQSIEKDGKEITKKFLDVRATQGSNINFDYIVDVNHPAKAAIVQLDLLMNKRSEDMINDTKLTDDILILMPLIYEDIHLVSRKGSSIKSLKDLEGMNVGIGAATEGTYSTAMYIQNTSKVSWNNKNISTMDALKELLLERIDAFFYVAGAPVQILAAIPPTSPLQIQLAELENINGWADYYTPLTLTKEYYNFLEANLNTFSVPSVVIVNKKKLSEEELALVKEWRSTIINKIDDLKGYGHKSWQTADPSQWDSNVWPVLE
jgi:TRAP transporter TAXI family solute receptor